MKRPLSSRGAPVPVLLVCALALVASSSSLAAFPDLPADADDGLREAHDAARAAYGTCADAESSAQLPWQLWAASGAAAGAVVAGVGAIATPFVVAAVNTPPQSVALVDGIAVGVLATAGIGAAAASGYFASSIPGAMDRASVLDTVLEIAEDRGQKAIEAKDADALSTLARELYEDCRAANGAVDGNQAATVVRDLQRYRREAEDSDGRLANLTTERDELLKIQETLNEKLDQRATELTQKEAAAALQDERIGTLEGRNAELESESESLKGEVARLEEEQASLSKRQQKLLEEKRKLEEKSSQYEEVANALQREVKDGKVALRRLKNGVVVEMANKVLFPSGKAELNDVGKETLAKVAEAIKTLKDKRIRIEGHTDSVPTGKNSEFQDNWALSSERALAVTRFLQENGVSPAKMSAEARSQYAPVASNRGPNGRARNRRIEIYLVPMPEKGGKSAWKPTNEAADAKP